ncbi:MAG: VCBS repeat-containing protein, partial [Planctomycetota bacterium]
LPVPGAAEDPRAVNRLFLGREGLRFVDRTAASGAAADSGYGQGCAAGDVDGDGDTDLYVTNFGADRLFTNDGAARFADGTAASGLGDPRWTAGATFFDADRDGDLDLYVTGYVAIDVTDPEWCGRREAGWRSYCHPDRYAGLDDRFWRNDGSGRFREETLAAGLTSTAGKGLGALPVDADLDGDLDLYVANDSVENKLWSNTDGRFEDATLLSGTGVNGSGATEAGMGLAALDFDGDLDLDLYVTNFDNESNTLYRNDGQWFSDATVAAGLEGPSRLPVGFGVVAEDFDLDGDPDLVVANGHIIHNIELYHDGKRWAQRPQLYINGGRRFTPGVDRAGDLARNPVVGRALLVGDLDRDGDGDLVLVECNGPARLLRNDAPAGDAGSWTVTGLEPHAVLRATLDDGGQRLLLNGPAPTYYGACAPEARVGLPPGRRLVTLERLSPAGPELELDGAREFAPGRWRLDL